jgi:ubiquitin carboxyl-terminal hydrolase 5/13
MEVLDDESMLRNCRVATPYDIVYNTECCYTFHTPYTTPHGILINLNTFIGTIDALAMIGYTDSSIPLLFLRIVKEYVPKPINTDRDDKVLSVPTKLAIGVEGGFLTDDDQYETITSYSVVVMKKGSEETTTAGTSTSPSVVAGNHTTATNHNTILADIPYHYTVDNDSNNLTSSFPSMVQESVNSIIRHVGHAIQTDITAWQSDDIPITKYYTTIPFFDNGVIIDPNPIHWKCQKTDTIDENLWLNLSDGFIGGGRKNWDVRWLDFLSLLYTYCVHGTNPLCLFSPRNHLSLFNLH